MLQRNNNKNLQLKKGNKMYLFTKNLKNKRLNKKLNTKETGLFLIKQILFMSIIDSNNYYNNIFNQYFIFFFHYILKYYYKPFFITRPMRLLSIKLKK